MKLKDWFLIGLLVGLSLLYTWYESNRPQSVNWSETYSPQDKIPYGTYVTYRSLPELFPQSRVRISRMSLPELNEQYGEEVPGVYIRIGTGFRLDALEMDCLLDWVGKGTEAFLAAEWMRDTLLDCFSLNIEGSREDSTSRFLFGGFEGKIYSFSHTRGNHFVLPDDFKGTVLGDRGDGKPDFIKIPYGQGHLFLNLNPQAFTNFKVLDSLNEDYFYKALSWLPDRSKVLLWDAYHTLGREGAHTPLRVILSYPALRLSLYLVLFIAFLHVLFRMKRRQRPIPVVRAPENKMLGFITMISLLYYRQKDHSHLAMKRIDFFLEEVRAKYYLPTDVLDARFVQLLSERTGIDKEKVEGVIRLIREIKQAPQVSEEMLKSLMKGTEIFLKQMNNSY
ncbi:DUF4350 domain-containing protein [Odoribacter sp. Z80]|uniref:DUF4350 domain-containing protein n=1 Tax=Odoribacter sp. Z80 TaxID=2304575 RepID=UPI001379E608|nr:DUF4350 domain-containing protein [Odoribacter sp. Z80]NCE72613.1 hypothetical protein [Odoribacter sp. Z80]